MTSPAALPPVKWSHERTHPVRSQSDRFPAHRRGADGPVQLAAGPPPRRPVPACGSTTPTRSGTSTTRSADPRRLPLDGHRLGRGPRGRRPARPLLPIPANRALPSGCRGADRLGPRLPRLQHRGRAHRRQGRRRARQAAPTASAASRLADDQLARYEAEGRPFALRFQVPLGRTVVRPRPDQGRRRVRDRRDRRLRDRPPRRLAALQLRQRRRRRRDADHPRRPRRGAPVEHVPAAPRLRSPGLPPARLRPRALRGRTGLEEEDVEAQTDYEAGRARLPAPVHRARATCPRPCSTTWRGWAGATTAARRSSPAPS